MHAVLWARNKSWSAGWEHRRVWLVEVPWNGLPKWVRVPYMKAMCAVLLWCPSSNGLVKSVVNLPGPPGKPEYSV